MQVRLGSGLRRLAVASLECYILQAVLGADFTSYPFIGTRLGQRNSWPRGSVEPWLYQAERRGRIASVRDAHPGGFPNMRRFWRAYTESWAATRPLVGSTLRGMARRPQGPGG